MSDLKITGTTPLPPVLHHGMTCPTCKKPRELKVDKPATMPSKAQGLRVRPMATHANKGRPNSRTRRKRDPRDVRYY
jgi:hypothetical protein